MFFHRHTGIVSPAVISTLACVAMLALSAYAVRQQLDHISGKVAGGLGVVCDPAAVMPASFVLA